MQPRPLTPPPRRHFHARHACGDAHRTAPQWITAPAVIIQPLSGAWLVWKSGYQWTDSWLIWNGNGNGGYKFLHRKKNNFPLFIQFGDLISNYSMNYVRLGIGM